MKSMKVLIYLVSTPGLWEFPAKLPGEIGSSRRSLPGSDADAAGAQSASVIREGRAGVCHLSGILVP